MDKPTKEQMDEVRKKFDLDNKVIESALRQLFDKFPENNDTAQVLLKVISVNSLYSTQIPTYSERIPTIWEVADHIVCRKIDAELDAGSTAIVYDIARIETPTKSVHFNYSFSTKYCSWHKPKLYPIYDSRVDEYLWRFMQSGHLSRFDRQGLKIYSKLKEIVSEFRDCCGLDDLDFKEIDKFLYVEGGKLLEHAKVPAPNTEDERLDVPCSEKIYASEQERKQARARFTDNDGWHIVSPPQGEPRSSK
jgi:hypothetical protein